MACKDRIIQQVELDSNTAFTFELHASIEVATDTDSSDFPGLFQRSEIVEITEVAFAFASSEITRITKIVEIIKTVGTSQVEQMDSASSLVHLIIVLLIKIGSIEDSDFSTKPTLPMLRGMLEPKHGDLPFVSSWLTTFSSALGPCA